MFGNIFGKINGTILKKRRLPSMQQILFWNNMLFILATMVLLLFFNNIIDNLPSSGIAEYNPSSITTLVVACKGDYASLQSKFRSLVGDDGFVEIADGEGHVIYSTNMLLSAYSDYTPYLLEIMSHLESFYKVRNSFTVSGKEFEGYVFYGYRYMAPGLSSRIKSEMDNYRYCYILAVDDDGEILINNIPNFTIRRLTHYEIGKLIQFGSDFTDEIKPFYDVHHFNDHNGDVRYIIYHIGKHHSFLEPAESDTAVLALWFTYFLIVISMALFITGNYSNKLRAYFLSIVAGLVSFTKGSGFNPDMKKVFFSEGDELVVLCRDLIREIQRLNNERAEVMSHIAHDLKMPIQNIVFRADMLKSSKYTYSEEQIQYLNEMYSEAYRLDDMVIDLNDFAQLSNPDFEVKIKRGDFAEFIRQLVVKEINTNNLNGMNVGEMMIPEEPVMAFFDEKGFEKIFRNILSNTYKYASDAQLYFSVSKHDGYVIFKMGDSGPGIPEDIKENVFNAFVTSNYARTSGKGTGIGLAIVKKMVDCHEGTISLDSEPGYNTVFVISFPTFLDLKLRKYRERKS